jgi:hypothetical protein
MLPCAVLFVIGLSGSCWIRGCWPRFAVVGHWQSLRSSLPHSGLLTSRRGDLAGVSHYVGLGLERVSGWGERRERKTKTNHNLHRGSFASHTAQTSHFLGFPCVNLPRQPCPCPPRCCCGDFHLCLCCCYPSLWGLKSLAQSFTFVSCVEGEMEENRPQHLSRPVFMTHRMGLPLHRSPLTFLPPQS